MARSFSTIASFGRTVLSGRATSQPGRAKARIAGGLFFATLAILAVDILLPPEAAESVLYALPVFAAGLLLSGRMLLTTTSLAFGFSAADLATSPGTSEDTSMLLDYWMTGLVVGAAAIGGWLLQQKRGLAGDGARCEPRWKPVEHFLNASLDYMCVAGLDGRIRYVNRSAADFIGRATDELIGARFLDFVHEDDRAAVTRAIASVVAGVDVHSLKVRIRRADGEFRLCEWTCPAVIPGEKVFYAAGRDVTDREKEEENTRLLASVVESSEDGIIGGALDGRITIWNRAAERIYGFSATEAIGQSIDLVVPEDRLDEFNQLFRQVGSGGFFEQLETKRRHKDGHLIDVSLTSSPIRGALGEIVGALVSVRDITDRKRDQQVLADMQARLERAVRGTSDGLWEWNIPADQVWCAPRFRELLGYEADRDFTEPFGSFEDRLHPADRESALAALREHVDVGGAFDIECRLRRRSGDWNWFRMRGASVRDSGGTPVWVSGSIQDISDNKRITQSLIDSEEQVRLLLDRMGEGIFGIDAMGKCTFCNPACARMLGYDSPDKLLHRPMHDLIHHSHADGSPLDALDCKIYGTLQSGEEHHCDNEVLWRADGTSFPVEYRAFPIAKDGERLGAVVTFCDISERLESQQKLHEKEEQLQHSQRMEAVGQLAGGIAHEYNNLLQAIIGFARFAQTTIPEDTPAHGDLEHVISASERAAILTRQLLNFSRRDTIRPVAIAIADVVAELKALLRPCLPASVDLCVAIQDGHSVLLADPNLLQQVLMNLCLNARDAMNSAGTLSISVRKVALTEENAPPAANLAPGPYVEISVSDTGTGIPQELQKRIFDPFFTTKEVGKGTGMGLALVFGVVQQHGGTVRVDSKPGAGATFRVFLPLHEDQSVRTVNEPEQDGGSLGGNELILVAEDNPVVRDVLVRILESSGYRTLAAEDGEEAVQQFSLYADEVDLLLFDVVMPRMNGKEAAAAIRLLRPEIAVTFCTAYDSTSLPVTKADFRSTFVVEKPFDKTNLLRIVRAALDRRDEEQGRLKEHQLVGP